MSRFLPRGYRGTSVPEAIDELDLYDDLRRQRNAQPSSDAERPEFATHPVRVTPMGLRNGTQGGQQIVTGGGPLIQVVNFAVDDIDAIPITVTILPVFSINASGGASLAVPFRPFVRVRWGTMGAVTEVDVDAGLGRQFMIGGSACTIQVGAEATGNVLGEGTAPVGAMISPWTSARQTPVYKTRYADTLAAGGNALFQVPNFAATLHSLQRSNFGSQVTIDFELPTTAIAYSVVIPAGVAQAEPIPLSSDITQVRVTNNSVNVLNIRAMFGLSL